MLNNNISTNNHEENYYKALQPHINEIKNDVLPKIDSSVVSKSPAYHGISYKKQTELAISGDADALRHLGVLLYDGINVPKKKELALNLLKTMAFSINMYGQPLINLPAAYSYAKLLLKERKFSDAIQILEHLISTDFLPAFALMGNIYQYGSGVTPSFYKADEYYHSAQSRGHIYAPVLRAKLYLQQTSPIKKSKGVFLWGVFLVRVTKSEILGKQTEDRWAKFY